MYLTDAPETRLVGVPTGQLEEGADSLEIKCLADANPPAHIRWRRSKSTLEIASQRESLILSPIERNHAGVYICDASNIEGESSPKTVQIHVNCECRQPQLLQTRAKDYVNFTINLNGIKRATFETLAQTCYTWRSTIA